VLETRFPYDVHEVPSLDILVQARGGSQVQFTGTVDSGADHTVLSREAAEELGLDPDSLHEAGNVVIADRSRVSSWTTLVPIRAQVLRRTPSDELLPWGPVFAIQPVFLEYASPLWGQSDFFTTFDVAFWRRITPNVFSLAH
jgi:hypothetical protein